MVEVQLRVILKNLATEDWVEKAIGLVAAEGFIIIKQSKHL
jgi:hypothetical protein